MFRAPRHRGAERRGPGSAGPCSFGRRQPRHVARDGRRALSHASDGLRPTQAEESCSWPGRHGHGRGDRCEGTRFEVGDEVFGNAKGSFAEYAAAREDKLTHKPESLAFEQAAVMGVSGLTALRALDIAGVAAGWRVLVVVASGGSEPMPSRSPSP